MPSAGAPGDPASSHRAIENLIVTDAALVDDGDFAGVGHLPADATFIGRNVPFTGRDAIETTLRDSVIVYENGTPHTKHLVTNIVVEVDEAAGAAAARSYVTALQALPDLPLQPIVSGRCHDRVERRDGRWRFVERRAHIDLVGDVSRHLRRTAVEAITRHEDMARSRLKPGRWSSPRAGSPRSRWDK